MLNKLGSRSKEIIALFFSYSLILEVEHAKQIFYGDIKYKYRNF